MMTVMSVPPGGKRSDDELSLGGGPSGRGSGTDVTTVSLTRGRRRSGRPRPPAGAPAGGIRPDPLADLHREQYRSLVRLASLVVGDTGVAEQITQDAFVRLQLHWGGLRRLDRAPAYLRSAVLNGARSHLRRRQVSDRHDARRTVAAAAVTPESAALGQAEQERVVAALRSLPDRQREAVVLRYYLDLPEADISAAMGVARGSVKTHLHRGLAALAQHLREEGK
jgi:RNA polymerase sigma-70 factor (sigma-E family)